MKIKDAMVIFVISHFPMKDPSDLKNDKKFTRRLQIKMFEKMDSSPKSGQYNPEYNLKPHKNKKVN